MSSVSITSTAKTADAPGIGSRILLVEDDPGSQDLIRALCESRGDTVDVAADGFLGLRLLSERRHEVVLVDYHLPEMDGYALARLMRELGRPEGRLCLIGITADRHGLASRRGADTLFDAILVKPLEPRALFATLERLRRPEPAPAPSPTDDPADMLWRRSGLPGRPRAILRPEPSAAEAEAVGQAFAVVSAPEEADIVLVSDEAGLAGLRDLRAEGAAWLLPAFDLTGRIGAACDGGFRVGDPNAWAALARTCLAFGERRAALPPAALASPEPKDRLAALMFVADRGLRLGAGDEPAGSFYETGCSRAGLMAALLQLMEAGSLACKPFEGGLSAVLTPAGREALLGGARPVPCPVPHRPQPADGPAAAAAHPLDREAAMADAEPPRRSAPPPMLFNTQTFEELHALLGPERIERMLTHMSNLIDASFAPGSDAATVARQAHNLISIAGSLGFERLVKACQAVQETVVAGADEAESVAHVREIVSASRTICAERLASVRAG
ncbi:response regulator [Methylobacterium sp. sgz302541]|uniref:response regulator n=1 Tax=unclassified Methylobacterium TaxID=2615210 RepID=UPI003D356787